MSFVGFAGFSLKTSQNAKVLRHRGLRKKCIFDLPNISGELSIPLEVSLKKNCRPFFTIFEKNGRLLWYHFCQIPFMISA